MLSSNEILKIAMEQSAVDLCAKSKDFEKSENVVVFSHESERVRGYLKLPVYCAA